MSRYWWFVILLFPVTQLYTHPGKTDEFGGHYVRTPGHGYPVGSYHIHTPNGVIEISRDKTEDSPVSTSPVHKEVKLKQTEPVLSGRDEKYQAVYRSIYQALKELKSGVSTAKYTTSSDYVFKVLDDVLEDNPEIFYFNYNGSLFYTSGWFQISYRYSKDTIQKMSRNLEAAVNYVCDNLISSGMSEYQKARKLHDFLVKYATYDIYNYDNGTIPFLSYTAYGVLINGVGVCEGYSHAYQLLTKAAGLNTICVSGRGKSERHGWNMINISGQWYHVDVTWDDPVPDTGGVRHDYFLISDSRMSADHSWDRDKYPASPVSYTTPQPESTVTRNSTSSYPASSYRPSTVKKEDEKRKEQNTRKKQVSYKKWKGVSLESVLNLFSLDSVNAFSILGTQPSMFIPPFTGLESYPWVYQSINRLLEFKMVFHPSEWWQFGLGYASHMTPLGEATQYSIAPGKVPHDGLVINLGSRLPVVSFLSFYFDMDWFMIFQREIDVVYYDDFRFSLGLDIKIKRAGFSVFYSWNFSDALSGNALRFEGLGVGFKFWL